MKPDFKTWLENKYTPKGGMTIGKLPSVIFTEPKPRILRDINEFASDFAEQEMKTIFKKIDERAVVIDNSGDYTNQYSIGYYQATIDLDNLLNQKFKEDES
jgi:hypothetical protein